jgi:hypothetical protein
MSKIWYWVEEYQLGGWCWGRVQYKSKDRAIAEHKRLERKGIKARVVYCEALP